MSLFTAVFLLYNNRNGCWVEETDLFSPGLEISMISKLEVALLSPTRVKAVFMHITILLQLRWIEM